MATPKMSDTKRVNPALMKAAAERAFPNIVWEQWSSFKGPPIIVDAETGQKDFNPLTSDSDAWALERALKKEANGWWDFGEDRNRTGLYEAYSPKHPENIKDASDTLLLLKCVSAMTSLPLYAEESMG